MKCMYAELIFETNDSITMEIPKRYSFYMSKTYVKPQELQK